MNFIINRETLLNPLQQIVGIIEKRQTMPILSNVFIKTDCNSLILIATDLEIQLITKVDLISEHIEAITVPARKLIDIVRFLPANSEIKWEIINGKLKLTSGRSRFSLNCLPSENYPEFTEENSNTQLSISADKFKEALEKTLFCMANQDVRYYLNGILLNISNNYLKLVASDGHRLSIYQSQLDIETGVEIRIILPRKGIIELNRLIDDTGNNLILEFSNNIIKLSHNHFIFSAKLVDAKYPDFTKVFQQDLLDPLYINKQTLKEALTRVSILSNEKFKGITLNIKENLMSITAHNPEHDEAEEEVSIDYKGHPYSISFNAQYLIDAVTHIDSDHIILVLTKNLSSCFINDPNNSNFQFIVMPMRL